VVQRHTLADGGSLTLDERWLDDEPARALFDALRDGVAWRTERIRIAGRWYEQPRLVSWFGDADASYTYSGLTLSPEPWPATIAAVRARLVEETGTSFNSVLCNYYRDGHDSMGFHADDEPELGASPTIASVSLGATRRFALRHKRDKGARLDLDLPGGSLLVMSGTTQHFWRHGVPKRQPSVSGRINLTFRRIFPAAAKMDPMPTGARSSSRVAALP